MDRSGEVLCEMILHPVMYRVCEEEAETGDDMQLEWLAELQYGPWQQRLSQARRWKRACVWSDGRESGAD